MEHIHVWISNNIQYAFVNGSTRKSVVRKFNCHIAFALIPNSALSFFLFYSSLVFFIHLQYFSRSLDLSFCAFLPLWSLVFSPLSPFFCSAAVLSSIFFVFTISMVFHFIVQLFRTIRSKHFLFEEAFFNCCAGRSYSLLLSRRSFLLVFAFFFYFTFSLFFSLCHPISISLHFSTCLSFAFLLPPLSPLSPFRKCANVFPLHITSIFHFFRLKSYEVYFI